MVSPVADDFNIALTTHIDIRVLRPLTSRALLFDLLFEKGLFLLSFLLKRIHISLVFLPCLFLLPFDFLNLTLIRDHQLFSLESQIFTFNAHLFKFHFLLHLHSFHLHLVLHLLKLSICLYVILLLVDGVRTDDDFATTHAAKEGAR